MKKQLFFLAVAALALASCSSENDVVQTPAVQQTANDEVAVDFDVYTSRGTTRGGDDGILTTEGTGSHEIKLTEKGFGVFGYYTNGEPYSGITKPNFFYNQMVKKDGSVWKYNPVKYWPNEFGEDAISDQVDRVSLFAYAPWVEVNGLTGIVTDDPTNNIVGMTRNTSTGDPFIKYTATMDATNSVDLCYGVAAEDFTSSNSVYNQNDIKKGDPYINVVKPGLSGKIKYDFKHALAQLTVNIDAVVNAVSATSTENVDQKYTRIWVRSVTFEGITQKGSLNLNGGEWYDVNGNNKITSGSLTVYDGRKDGKEANDAATNETPQTLNSTLVQSNPYTISGDPKVITSTTPVGVTNTTVNLFKHAGSDDAQKLSDPVFVIPTGEKMKVTIVYDVETYDSNLAFYLSDGSTPGSTIENNISKTIDTFGYIEAGKHYVLNLHLGMRTVDFEAEVADWVDVNADADLPSNLPTFKAGNSHTVTLGANVTTYQFAISGLAANEATSRTTDNTIVIQGSSSIANANSSGIAIGTMTLKPNTTTAKTTTGYMEITGTTSPTRINIIQLPHELGLSASELSAGTKTITLTSTATDVVWTDAVIKISKTPNGGSAAPLTKDALSNGFTVSGTGTGTITLTENAASGDIYVINVTSGEAEPETVTVTVR